MTPQQIMEIAKSTPDIGTVKHEEFVGYIVGISNKGKENPYMTVDGRVMMACLDHLRQGKKLDYGETTVLVDNDDQLTLQVTITSEMYGKRHGIASSDKKKTTAEGVNPWEVAETSAIGRALSQFGYGVFAGSGLPSANDMQRVAAQQNKPAPPAAPKPADKPRETYVRTTPPLSPVQKNKMLELYRLLHPGDDVSVSNGLDAMFLESFKHNISEGTYEEGARLTGILLSEIRKVPGAVAEKSKDTNGNGASITNTKPVATDRGGICATHNEPTHEYKKADGTLFWFHRHENEPCTHEPKPETVLEIPGGVK